MIYKIYICNLLQHVKFFVVLFNYFCEWLNFYTINDFFIIFVYVILHLQRCDFLRLLLIQLLLILSDNVLLLLGIPFYHKFFFLAYFVNHLCEKRICILDLSGEELLGVFYLFFNLQFHLVYARDIFIQFSYKFIYIGCFGISLEEWIFISQGIAERSECDSAFLGIWSFF